MTSSAARSRRTSRGSAAGKSRTSAAPPCPVSVAKPTVLVTRPLPGGALELLSQHADVRLRQGDLPPSAEELRRLAPGCHGRLTLLTDPGAGGWQTWGPSLFLGQDVHGATLGIVGLGGVGTAVAKRARGFGMTTVYYSRSRKPALERRYKLTFVSLDDLLRQSDIVTLHVALTPETQRIIGRRELRLMKVTAVLVNTGRGPLVDQAALYEALKAGLIAGAALDVTDPEPLPAGDPLR